MKVVVTVDHPPLLSPFLSNSKHGIVVQPFHIAHSFSQLNLAVKLSCLPVEGGYVTLASTNEQLPVLCV